MSLESSLQRLSKKVTPRDGFAETVKSRLMRRIGAEEITASALATRPTKAFHNTVKHRILHAVKPPLVESLLSLVSRTQPASRRKPSLRHHAMPKPPLIHSWVKWSAACALFLLIIRSMPLILLAPSTLAEASVQILPAGDTVTMFIGGIWQNVTEPQVLQGPAMISTGTSRATIVLNGGVFRLNPATTLKIHTVGVRDGGPTATLVGDGQVWALGLLPPGVDGLALETDAGMLQLNAGSASVNQNGSKVSVAVYDKGVTFAHDGQPMFLISGEKTSFIDGKTTSITTMPVSVFADPSVADNLSQDAVHRAQIAALQQERRIEMAGILPTSVLYKAKRIAEQVDVLFTLTDDGKTAKRLEQANTRLSEALALWKSGYHDEAQVPLSEYSDALVALASDAQGNIVQDLIKQQIVDASATLTSSNDDDAQRNIAFLHDAVQRVDAAIPHTTLSSLDIQGYVLVDKLAEISKILSIDHNPHAAATMYLNIRPYLTSLLAADSGIHPLLQKEANVHLVSIATHLRDAQGVAGTDTEIIAAMTKDLVSYLPEDTASIEELNATADAYVQKALARILNLDMYSSRYNELLREMDTIISDRTNPNRGLYLRKLKGILPADLQDYVNVGIKRLGDELNN